jgi:hypothetical protein
VIRVADLNPGGPSVVSLGRVLMVLNSIPGNLSRDDLSYASLISFGEALVYWVFDTLEDAKLFPGHLCLLVVQFFGDPLKELGDAFYRDFQSRQDWQPTAMVLAVSNRRYLCGPPDVSKWYDTQSCGWLDKPPSTLEGVSYNIAMLAFQQAQRLQDVARRRQDVDAKFSASQEASE